MGKRNRKKLSIGLIMVGLIFLIDYDLFGSNNIEKHVTMTSCDDIGMEDKLTIMKYITSNSGYSYSAYKDKGGNSLIGFGTMIRFNHVLHSSANANRFYRQISNRARQEIEKVPYVRFKDLINNKTTLSKSISLKLFSIEFDRINDFLHKEIRGFSELSLSKKAALFDLTYFLKEPKLKDFNKFLEECNKGDWAGAAEMLRISLYYDRTPERLERDRQLLINENWDETTIILEPNPEHFFSTLDDLFATPDCLKFVIDNDHETIFESEMLSSMTYTSYQLAEQWLDKHPNKRVRRVGRIGIEQTVSPEDIIFQFEENLVYSLERRKKASFHDKVCGVLRTAREARNNRPDHWSDKMERHNPYAALDFVTEVLDPLLTKCDALQLEREKERTALEKENIEREIDRSVDRMERDVRAGNVTIDRTGHGRTGQISRTASIIRIKNDWEKSVPSYPTCF